jgi:hypothetical protein
MSKGRKTAAMAALSGGSVRMAIAKSTAVRSSTIG